VSAATHSRILTPMKPKFAEYLSSTNFKKQSCQIIRNVDAEFYKLNNKEDFIYGLVEQLDHRVLFKSSIELAIRNKVTDFYDLGSNGVLSRFIEDVLVAQNYKAAVHKILY
jgi:[acyl-carrier-protein] S-malonyltransferase